MFCRSEMNWDVSQFIEKLFSDCRSPNRARVRARARVRLFFGVYQKLRKDARVHGHAHGHDWVGGTRWIVKKTFIRQIEYKTIVMRKHCWVELKDDTRWCDVYCIVVIEWVLLMSKKVRRNA